MIVALVAVLNLGFLATFKLLLLLLATYILFIAILSVISKNLSDVSKVKQKVDKVIDVVAIKKDVTDLPLSVSTKLSIMFAQNLDDNGPGGTEQRLRKFGIRINAISVNDKNRTPDYFCHLYEIKALYEMRKLYGDEYYAMLPKHAVTIKSIIRPLEAGEITEFHLFAKKCFDKPQFRA